MRYSFGDYVLDTQCHELHHAGAPIKLRRKVFQVLVYLLAHRERVVPKQELLAQLWPGQFVGDETLTSCIKTLRRALGERGRTAHFLRTLHGQGYRFVGAVEVGEPRPADEAPEALPLSGGAGAALHAKIVEALEVVDPDRLAEQVERLAYHALCGEVWDKALSYSRQAGARAGTRSAYPEAVSGFEQALKALTHLPESRDTLEQAIDLRLSLRTALLPLGELRRIHHLLRDAATLAEALGDQRRLGLISTRLCHASWQIGDYEAALAFGQRALAISMALGDVRWRRRTNVNLADTYHALGEYGRAIACYRTAVSLDGGCALGPLARLASTVWRLVPS
jgi:DNA-binding winged helix-turn-helix (wHTH) protein